jgi:hypothetical protein
MSGSESRHRESEVPRPSGRAVHSGESSPHSRGRCATVRPSGYLPLEAYFFGFMSNRRLQLDVQK